MRFNILTKVHGIKGQVMMSVQSKFEKMFEMLENFIPD